MTTEVCVADEIDTNMKTLSRGPAFFMICTSLMTWTETSLVLQDSLFVDHKIFSLWQVTVGGRCPSPFCNAARRLMFVRDQSQLQMWLVH